jgi:hypothetical protein
MTEHPVKFLFQTPVMAGELVVAGVGHSRGHQGSQERAEVEMLCVSKGDPPLSVTPTSLWAKCNINRL